MTKKLREEVMTSPVCAIKELNNNRKYENWSYENWSNYEKQRNTCTNILKKTKTNYFNNIDIKNITDNERFWTAAKPFITDKSETYNKIILNETIKQ